jgi:hypothetical protein
MDTHRYMSTDSHEFVSCLVCGGMWQDNEPTATYENDYTAFNGDDPSPCPGAIDPCHHYKGECPETVCALRPECNCVSCIS